MTTPNTKMAVPDRAIASILFACSSLLVWRAWGHLHWDVLGRLGSLVPVPVREQLLFPESDLAIANHGLAIAALIWCVWSWRKEWWLPSVVATLFTALALFVAFFIDS
jgi:hypothetical protein